MDTSSYISLNIGNPLCYLLGGSLCYLVSGVSVLVVGVIITSVTFQNLDHHYLANKERYAGPVLICAGMLIMGKGAVFHVKECQCRNALKRHWNGLCRRLVREDSESAIYLGPTDSEEGAYSDDPPPYDSVAVNTGTMVTSRVQIDNAISSSLPSLPPYDEGLVNPALDLSTETFPAPPPYEMVAVQPPSYSTGADVIERPVRAVRQNVHGLKRKTLDPTRHTVHEVAQRLVESIQAEQALRTQSETQQEASELTDVAIPGLAMHSVTQHEDVHMADGHNSCSRSVVFPDAEVLQTGTCSQMPRVSELLRDQEGMPCHRDSDIDPGTPEVVHDPVEEADLSGPGSDLVAMEDVPSSSNKVGIHDLVEHSTASSANCVIHSVREESAGLSTDQIISNDCSSIEVLSVMGESFINCQEEEQNFCPGVHPINTKERSHCIHHADTAAAGGLDPEGGALEPDSAHALSTDDIVKEECTDLEAIQSVSSVEQMSST